MSDRPFFRPVPARTEPGQVVAPAPVPFDMLPRRLRSDPRVRDRDYRVYAAIVSCCWGSAAEMCRTNAELAQRAGGCSIDTLQRSLQRLERLGYVLRIVDPTVRAGRWIRLMPLADSATSQHP